MTIEKGEPWGTEAKVPADVVYASSDREVATSGGTVIVVSGNLHQSLGRPAPKTAGDECVLLPVDALRVEIVRSNGTSDVVSGVSEVSIGSWWSRAGFLLVTNTGHLGALHVAPRAHPNDGTLDTIEIDGRMPLRERWVARRRARTGTHLPHPMIRAGRTVSLGADRKGTQRLRVDGADQGDWVRVTVTVDADRWLVAV